MVGPFVVQIERGTGTGTRFMLGATATIGRQQGLEITVQDPQASRQHARLEVREDRVLLTDLGAANGTFVNNERISGVVALLPGDTIQVGETTLRLLGVTAPQAQTVVATPSPNSPPAASPVAVTAPDMPRLGQGGPSVAPPVRATNRLPLFIGLGIGAFLLLCLCVATVLALVAR